jgi:hypothetical protein
MKINLKAVLLTAGFSAIALIGSARAQVINVDVNKVGGSDGTYSGVGAAPDTGTVWNGLTVGNNTGSSYTVNNLQNSTGTTTGVSINLSTTGLITSYDASENPAAFAPALLNDFAYNNQSLTNTITLSGLNSGDAYNLYIYAQNGGYDSGGGSYTIGGTTLEAANTGALSSTAFIQGNNYVEFVGLTGSSSIVATENLADAGSGGANYFNGLQLVDTTPVVEAPEPSTVALLGLGALGLAFLVVRRRHSLV